MQSTMNIYADQIHPLVEKITRLARENDIPMLMAFCLERMEKGEGIMQMSVAGATNLGQELEPPQPMLFAASMLRIPDFNNGYRILEEEENHDF